MSITAKLDDLYEAWSARLSEPPASEDRKTVYHYTNASGLMGILQSGKIFATDRRFLNDKSELSYGVERAKQLLSKIRKSSNEEIVTNFCDSTLDCLEIPPAGRHFIFSMSEREDDLSQWRGYANEGEGFAIGFCKERLSQMCTPESDLFAFRKVDYTRKAHDAVIQSAYNDVYSLLKSEKKHSIANSELCAHYLDLIIEIQSTFHKHYSFSNEREWRITSFVYDGGKEQIMVRRSENRLIPYIEIQLSEDIKDIPINSIGIGPSFSNPAIKDSVEDLCNWVGISPRIYNASTPYVRY